MNLLDNYLGENLREIAPFDLQKYWRQLYQLVGTIFLLFIKNFPQNSKIGWELKTTRWFVFYTWPSIRLVLIPAQFKNFRGNFCKMQNKSLHQLIFSPMFLIVKRSDFSETFTWGYYILEDSFKTRMPLVKSCGHSLQ